MWCSRLAVSQMRNIKLCLVIIAFHIYVYNLIMPTCECPQAHSVGVIPVSPVVVRPASVK